MDSVRRSPLSEAVRYLGPKKLDQIVEAIGECDVGVIPNRRSIFTELNTPTRIFEYLSQGKPVIAPRAPGILDYFGPQELILFELGDADDLAAKIEYVFKQPEQIFGIVERGQEVYRAHEWSAERPRFIESRGQAVEDGGAFVRTSSRATGTGSREPGMIGVAVSAERTGHCCGVLRTPQDAVGILPNRRTIRRRSKHVGELPLRGSAVVVDSQRGANVL